MDAGESAGLGANDGLWVGIVDGSPAGVALQTGPSFSVVGSDAEPLLSATALRILEVAGVTGDGLAAGSGACAGRDDGRAGGVSDAIVPFPDTTGTAGFAEGFEVLGFEALGFPLVVDFVDLFLAVVFAGGDTSATSASDGIIPLGFLGLPRLRITSTDIPVDVIGISLLLTESGEIVPERASFDALCKVRAEAASSWRQCVL